MRLDHVVIKVDDLDAASAAYAALGLPVTPGGEHPRLGSRNTLVACAGGAYLELIAFRRSGPVEPRAQRMAALADEGRNRLEQRWLGWAAVAPGLVDFAVAPGTAAEDWAALRARGLDYDGPLPMSRRRPDGQEVRWEMGFPEATDLPFFIRDRTPRELRVPEPPADAPRLARIALLVADAAAAAARCERLFGQSRAPAAAAPLWGETQAAFTCGDTAILLVEPGGDPALAAIFEARGEGVCAIELQRPDMEGPRWLDPEAAHGARIRLTGA